MNKHNCTWSKAQAQGKPGIACHCELFFCPNTLGNESVSIEDADWIAQIMAGWYLSAWLVPVCHGLDGTRLHPLFICAHAAWLSTL